MPPGVVTVRVVSGVCAGVPVSLLLISPAEGDGVAEDAVPTVELALRPGSLLIFGVSVISATQSTGLVYGHVY